MDKRLEQLAERLARIGPRAATLEDEIAAGYADVPVGSVPWLPSADWPDDILVTTDGKEVRIILLQARTIGAGAFSRMITGIAKAGMMPVVISPMLMMPDILHRWGWSERVVGSGWERQEQCRPSLRWLAARADK